MGRFEPDLDCLLSPHEFRYWDSGFVVQADDDGANGRYTTAPMNSVDLASLLCSRLCHDLMSPVGALNNGLELLADEQDPDMRERCMELLAESARTTANKLKFFRLAFGAGGGFGEAIDTGEAKSALEGLLSTSKVELGWMSAQDKLSKGATKLLLNLALIAGDSLVRGGRLDVGVESGGGVEGGTEIVIRAEGPRIALDPVIQDVLLTGSEGPIEPRSAGAWLAQSLAAEVGGTVQLSRPSDEVLVIGAVLPAPA